MFDNIYNNIKEKISQHITTRSNNCDDDNSPDKIGSNTSEWENKVKTTIEEMTEKLEIVVNKMTKSELIIIISILLIAIIFGNNMTMVIIITSIMIWTFNKTQISNEKDTSDKNSESK